jgi:hypothetical protein
MIPKLALTLAHGLLYDKVISSYLHPTTASVYEYFIRGRRRRSVLVTYLTFFGRGSGSVMLSP